MQKRNNYNIFYIINTTACLPVFSQADKKNEKTYQIRTSNYAFLYFIGREKCRNNVFKKGQSLLRP